MEFSPITFIPSWILSERDRKVLSHTIVSFSINVLWALFLYYDSSTSSATTTATSSSMTDDGSNLLKRFFFTKALAFLGIQVIIGKKSSYS